MAKKSVSEPVEQKPRKARKVQPVVLVVAEVPTDSPLVVGERIHDESIHDLVSAAKFVNKAGFDGKFEVIKTLGTIDSTPVVKRKVIVS